ncbi:hypothetical protein PRUPE_2G246700 [Prunus persica]|uniref:Uncharacterized protein n=1 Tax=Prunus persica TaxID=3760 RepID=A0A251QPD0_PRUPE|nr:hypothetical protein PRUPE_2G246700 [Prunus persica]
MFVSRFYEAFPYSLPMQQGFSQCSRLLELNQELPWNCKNLPSFNPMESNQYNTSIPKSYLSLILLRNEKTIFAMFKVVCVAIEETMKKQQDHLFCTTRQE